jgi:nitrogen regulatory protein P-II 1
MKLITAVIKPHMLDRLSLALLKAPITGFTVTDARGHGRDDEGMDMLNARVRIDIVLLEDDVKQVCDLIIKICSTHQEGDGILYVTTVDSVVNIRTGAIDREALLVR